MARHCDRDRRRRSLRNLPNQAEGPLDIREGPHAEGGGPLGRPAEKSKKIIGRAQHIYTEDRKIVEDATSLWSEERKLVGV